jgi:DNA-directed RNA polymerase specialized sigma24 family protein
MSMLVTDSALAERRDEPASDREAEHRLIESAKRDPQALAQLYRQHYEAISRHVLRRVGRISVAEDLVADVFLAMVRYLPRYRVGATRKLHDVPSAAEAGDPAQKADHVRSALLALPISFQSVLSLHYLDEMSVREIAQVIGCAEGTVKSRLSRGRDQLRAILTESEGD